MEEDSTSLPPSTMTTEDNNTNHHGAALTKGMEHLRPYVSVPSRQTPSSAPSTTFNPTTTTTTTTDEPESVYGIPSTALNPLRHPHVRPTSPESTSSNPQKRTDPFQFGSRLLTDTDDIFSFNAWDHVEVDAAYLDFADLQYARQRDSPVSEPDRIRFNGAGAPERWWNKFYTNNAANFFKDRKWLFQEFPALEAVTREGAGKKTVLEVGAGAGNTAFPVIAANRNEELTLHACDFSKTAVELIRNNPAFDPKNMHADVWDVASPTSPFPPGLTAGTVDIVILIFIFSALAPSQWAQALQNIYDVLKPGGLVLFRDYGRGDLAQVRFKKGRWLGENFYIRGDGTRVYFFERDELEALWKGDGNFDAQGDAGQTEDTTANDTANDTANTTTETTDVTTDSAPPPPRHQQTPKFDVLDLGVDRRMLVNRQRKLKMYRCWMQGRFAKPLDGESGGAGSGA